MEKSNGGRSSIVNLFLALLIFGGIFGVIYFLTSGSSNTGKSQQTLGPSPSMWYYINSDLKCVQAPGLFSNEDSCQNAVGTSCYSGDPTCENNNRTATLYYINSQNQCVVAPHNPYSITLSGGQTAGILGEESNCQSDIGEPCYADSTCGGAGNPGMITIQGVAYKLVTVSELVKNANNPGFADSFGSTTSTLSMVAVQGTITNVFQEKGKIDYALIINTGNGSVIFNVGTIDINTNRPNGVDISAFPVGTKISAGGVFTGNVSLQELISNVPQLGDIGLPANTPVILNAAGGIEVIN